MNSKSILGVSVIIVTAIPISLGDNCKFASGFWNGTEYDPNWDCYVTDVVFEVNDLSLDENGSVLRITR